MERDLEGTGLSGRPAWRFSGRLPEDFEPNPLSRILAEKRSRGREVLDLTITNPTKVGLSVAPARIGEEPIGAYEPDPKGALAARAAVAAYLAEREGRDVVAPDRLVLTASTSESYAHLFRLLCDPGGDVLVPTPSYPLFEPIARMEGVEVREYALRAEHRERAERDTAVPASWRVDVGELDALTGPRTRAILLVQPNNPTGSCVTAEDLAAVEDLAERRGLAIVSDEVFGDVPWPPRSAPLPSLLAGSRRVPTFVLGGISKLCGLPQLKLGWIAVAGPERDTVRLLEGLEWIADLFLSTSAPVEGALPRLLGNRHEFHAALRERLVANLASLRRANGPFHLIEAEGGWSAVLRGPHPPFEEAEDHALWMLEHRDVLVHPGHFYGLGDEHVVVSLIVPPAVLEEGLARISDGMGRAPSG